MFSDIQSPWSYHQVLEYLRQKSTEMLERAADYRKQKQTEPTKKMNRTNGSRNGSPTITTLNQLKVIFVDTLQQNLMSISDLQDLGFTV